MGNHHYRKVNNFTTVSMKEPLDSLERYLGRATSLCPFIWIKYSAQINKPAFWVVRVILLAYMTVLTTKMLVWIVLDAQQVCTVAKYTHILLVDDNACIFTLFHTD